MMKTFFVSLGILFTILFILGAVLQYNDPDTWIWVGIYGVPALLSLLFVLDRLNAYIAMFFGALAIIGFIYLYPSDFQGFDLNDGDIVTVEMGREAFGLLIIAVVLFTYAFRIGYLSKSKV